LKPQKKGLKREKAGEKIQYRKSKNGEKNGSNKFLAAT
jgi:hypothetical protein